jgi:hypothetical protein
MSKLLRLASQFVDEQIKVRRDIKGVLLVGSVARNEATAFSDIDLRFIIEGDTKHLERIDTWRENIYIEGTPESFENYSSLDSILPYPIRANDMNQGQLLYDPEGFFHNLQKEVRKQFIEPHWLSQRVRLIADRIPPGLKNLEQAISEDNALGICHSAGRLVFHLALIPLIARGISPSSTRHLAQLGDVYPVLKQYLCTLEGSDNMTVAQTMDLTNIIEKWEYVQSQKMSHLNCYMLEKSRWMVNNNLHKEAVHALWINSSFKANSTLQIVDLTGRQKGEQLALEWLNTVGWQAAKLKQKLADTTKIWETVNFSVREWL